MCPGGPGPPYLSKTELFARLADFGKNAFFRVFLCGCEAGKKRVFRVCTSGGPLLWGGTPPGQPLAQDGAT